MNDKTKAVVLFNLGGPQNQEEVYPFLKGLFSDPAILPLPFWIRNPLGAWIAKKRTPAAQEIYGFLGGGSPLIKNTFAQAEALEQALGQSYRVVVAMRHGAHGIPEAVDNIKKLAPQNLFLLPLYPQFSMTTTGSFFEAWMKVARRKKLVVPTQRVCCYPTLPGFTQAVADLVEKKVERAEHFPFLLFSAHGLPEYIVEKKRDPYVDHVRLSVERVIGFLEKKRGEKLSHQICFQSKVGPLKWTRPSLNEALQEAASRGQKEVMIVPIAFVSEHSETLVELDIEAKEFAEKLGLVLDRTPTVSTHPLYIKGLRELVHQRELYPRSCSLSARCWKSLLF